jgi:hypothetical protein
LPPAKQNIYILPNHKKKKLVGEAKINYSYREKKIEKEDEDCFNGSGLLSYLNKCF